MRRHRLVHTLFRAALVAAALSVPSLAAAQEDAATRARAQALFDEAQELLKVRDFARACPKLEEVNNLLPGKIGALMELAACYEGWGKTTSAWARYRTAADVATKTRDPRKAEADAKVAALGPQVPRLVVVVPDSMRAVSGMVIETDGVPLGPASWGTSIPVDPGAHEVSAAAPNKRKWSTKIEVNRPGGDDHGDHPFALGGGGRWRSWADWWGRTGGRRGSRGGARRGCEEWWMARAAHGRRSASGRRSHVGGRDGRVWDRRRAEARRVAPILHSGPKVLRAAGFGPGTTGAQLGERVQRLFGRGRNVGGRGRPGLRAGAVAVPAVRRLRGRGAAADGLVQRRVSGCRCLDPGRVLSMQRTSSAILLAMVAAAPIMGCQCVLGLDNPNPYPATGTTTITTATGGNGGNGGTSGSECDSPDECPEPENTCLVRTCESGSCGVSNARMGTPCGDAPSCSAGEQVNQDTCNGAGVCVDQGKANCAPYTCGDTACRTSCGANSDCIQDTICQDPPDGTCVGIKLIGEPCNAVIECQSGFCIDGVCCDSACSGQCSACSAAAGAQTPDGQCGATQVCGEQLAAGAKHACSVRPSGVVDCWGQNLFGQLGDGTTNSSGLPQTVTGMSTAVGVAAGIAHTCALMGDGTVKCWGDNGFGQLGDGTFNDKPIPVAVQEISDAIAISAGGNSTCAVLKGGAVRCWGSNGLGQLGDDSTTNKSTPSIVSSLSAAVAVAVGWAHACALLADGTVHCWGQNTSGQVGDGTFDVMKLTPVAVLNVSNAAQLTAGDYHTCALLSSAESANARCWGENNLGQLGCGACGPAPKAAPVTPVNVFFSTSLAAGGSHTCARKQDGHAACWGANASGQLGNGTTNSTTTFVNVNELSGAASIDAGEEFTCAALADNTVACWGSNVSGQLGTGGDMDSTTPVKVQGLSD